MGSTLWKVSTIYKSPLMLRDAAGTGKTGESANFTKALYKDGASSAVTVTVTEVASGLYEVDFTPNATGRWVLIVSHATYRPAGWMDRIDVGDASGIGAAIESAVQDQADGIETGITNRKAMRANSAVLAGQVTGAPGSPAHKAINNADTTRVTTTADTDGNRSAVTLNL